MRMRVFFLTLVLMSLCRSAMAGQIPIDKVLNRYKAKPLETGPITQDRLLSLSKSPYRMKAYAPAFIPWFAQGLASHHAKCIGQCAGPRHVNRDGWVGMPGSKAAEQGSPGATGCVQAAPTRPKRMQAPAQG